MANIREQQIQKSYKMNHSQPTNNKAEDNNAGFVFSEEFKPFNQINDIFSRAFWDKKVRSDDSDAFFESYRVQPLPRKAFGFKQKDFALRNASWAVSDIFSNRGSEEGKREGFQAPMENDTPIAKEKIPIQDIEQFTVEMKNIAKFFGADLVGITLLDKRWHYSHRVDNREVKPVSNDLPEELSHVIVLGHSMKKTLIDTYPSALAGAAAGLEYSREAAIVTQLTSYIKSLGYNAIGSMNDTALAIPYAIKAGLGEYGRHQMVITPEFGPRVRFSKIFTSLSLKPDQAKKFRITEYCNKCTKCADACPPKALPYGKPTFGTDSPSTIQGIKKWSANCEKCFGYWAKLRSDCAICMRVCPFNRDFSKLGSKIFRLIATSRLQPLALWWEKKVTRFKRIKPDVWWSHHLK